MQEIWKDIEDYEGLYQVSNLGKVKSLPKLVNRKNNSKYLTNEKILKPLSFGYARVILSNKSYSVHRLVAEAFIPNPNNLPIINHKDGNKQNNCIDNLEWCDYSYNNKEAYRIGLNKSVKPNRGKTR